MLVAGWRAVAEDGESEWVLNCQRELGLLMWLAGGIMSEEERTASSLPTCLPCGLLWLVSFVLLSFSHSEAG